MDTRNIARRDFIHANINLHHLYPRTPAERTAWIEANRVLVSAALAPLFARYPGLTGDDRDDVTAAGLRALVEAVDKYEPGHGAKLSSYAFGLIQFAGRKALAKCGDWKAKRAGIAVSSLDAPIETGNGTTARVDLVADDSAVESFADLLDVADENEKAAALWAWIEATVTPAQWEALRLCYAGGQSAAEVAERLGVSRQGVSGRVQNALAKLQKAAGTKDGRRVARQIFGAE